MKVLKQKNTLETKFINNADTYLEPRQISTMARFGVHSFFISIRPNLSLKLCLMVCLISKLISWSDITFDMNPAMVSFKHSNLNIQLSLT